MGGMVVVKTTYSHTHVLENGRLVIHAHPYQKQNDTSPDKQHTHSPFQLVMIDILSLLYFAAISLFVFLLAGIPVIWSSRSMIPVEVPSVLQNGRSPPVFC
jgi:hypothetical protein